MCGEEKLAAGKAMCSMQRHCEGCVPPGYPMITNFVAVPQKPNKRSEVSTNYRHLCTAQLRTTTTMCTLSRTYCTVAVFLPWPQRSIGFLLFHFLDLQFSTHDG